MALVADRFFCLILRPRAWSERKATSSFRPLSGPLGDETFDLVLVESNDLFGKADGDEPPEFDVTADGSSANSE